MLISAGMSQKVAIIYIFLKIPRQKQKIWEKEENSAVLEAMWSSVLCGCESTAGEIIPSNTRHQCRLTTGLLMACVCLYERVCARVCVYSIISPVGDSHKLTWNFLNKGLIFTGSCCTVKEGGPLSFSWMYLQNQTLKTKLCVETSGTSSVFYCQSVVSKATGHYYTINNTLTLFQRKLFFPLKTQMSVCFWPHSEFIVVEEFTHLLTYQDHIRNYNTDTQTVPNAGSDEIWLLQRQILPYCHLF